MYCELCMLFSNTLKVEEASFSIPLHFREQSRMQVTEFLGIIVLLLVFRCSEFRNTIYEAKLWDVYESILQCS